VNTGSEFYCQLNLGLLQRSKKYLPLKYTGQFTIELYLEQNSECLVSSVATVRGGPLAAGAQDRDDPADRAGGPVFAEPSYPNLNYLLDQVYLHCHFVVPNDAYDKEMLSKIENGGLDIYYDTFSTTTRQIQSETGSKSTHSFQERAMSLKGGYAIMQNEANIGDLRTDAVFSANYIVDYQWKLGSMYSPAQPIECRYGGAEALAELQDSIETSFDMGSSGSIQSENFCPMDVPGPNIKHDRLELLNETERPFNFIMGLNLEKTEGQLSGFNTSATNTDVELILNVGKLQRSKYRYICDEPNFDAWAMGTVNTQITVTIPAIMANAAAQDVDATILFDRLVGRDTEHGSLHLPGVRLHPSLSIRPIGIMAKKKPSTFSRLTFFAHIDAIFKIQGVGSIQILR
jgi:hypothetical protein